MVAIKLRRVGKRGQATFRVVVAEARSRVQGAFIEDLGWVNPHTNDFAIQGDRAAYWVGRGAQPTATVRNYLKKAETREKGRE